jgi:hypothetical protein
MLFPPVPGEMLPYTCVRCGHNGDDFEIFKKLPITTNGRPFQIPYKYQSILGTSILGCSWELPPVSAMQRNPC